MIKISKSDYVLGIKCLNALWFKKYRKDLETEKNQAVLDNGTAVGELACDRFPGGVRITAKPWEDAAITQTKSAISGKAPFIYEATLSTDTGEYCAVDILRNNNDGTWDIIEVKSTTEPHDYHYIDASFQRYVFTKCGINVRNCFIMTLNKEYVRHGNLDLEQLFALHDVTADLQDIETVQHEIERIRAVLGGTELGIAISKVKCNKFYECPYKHHCWKDVPQYSVFDAFKGAMADKVYSEYGADLSNVPAGVRANQSHPGDIEAFLDNVDVINKDILRDFTKKLHWPLYFLDYESIMSAVPMFDNSRPYQQICFQFSLHVQREPGAELEHYEYLHDDPNTDPRPGLIKKLIETIGDTGSVIVYNQIFEQGRNTEMARDFPEYADQLNAINARMVDLLIPFRLRGLYRPCQNGSASIKQTLPAFVPEMSYENLGIHNGDEASKNFMDFMTGKQTPDQTKQMMSDLHEYCGQDTMAMVHLLNVILTIVDTGWAKFNVEDADIVILGTYPGKKSLKAKQFYADPKNQFWDLLKIERTPDNYEERRKKLKEMKIGLWDVLAYCDRQDVDKDTSLDKNIKDEIYNNLSELIGKKKILFNGQKAYKFYKKSGYSLDNITKKDNVLLSSSRACAKTPEDKRKDWMQKLKIE